MVTKIEEKNYWEKVKGTLSNFTGDYTLKVKKKLACCYIINF